MSYQLNAKVASLKPYDPISGCYSIRLDANESFIEIPEDTRADMLSRISGLSLNRYPDPMATEACGLFAAYHSIDPALVTAGNGSDELLSIISQAFLIKGERALFLSPDFSMYRFYSEIAEADVLTLSKRPDGSVDPDAVIDRINTESVRLFIFSNPCNPTGLGMPASEVLRICSSCPDCLIVVDEAYMDFWDQSVIGDVGTFDNLMVLRTCSKAFRMAGIRCGFAVAGSPLTGVVRAVKSPYNVSMLTQAAAAAILSRPDELHAAIGHICASRDSLLAELSEMALQFPERMSVSRSLANFAYIIMPGNSAEIMFEALKQRSIVVRSFGNALRVTAGSPDENAEFIRAFEENLIK